METALGHRFRRAELLEQALTHSSWARELEAQDGGGPTASADDNEQLEFLGDAVLGFVTSQELFQQFPHYREGQLSKARAYLVSGKHLIRSAKKLKLGQYLRLGHGEEKSGGRLKAALQVNALEAVLAAVYLDAGLDKARQFILKQIIGPELKKLAKHGEGFPITDYKSALQEMAYTVGCGQPSYAVIKEEGPEHRKTFTVEARLDRGQGKPEFAGRAKGPTKKKAEQDAAKKALAYLWSLQDQDGAAEGDGRGRRATK